jgi:hypothetical protein
LTGAGGCAAGHGQDLGRQCAVRGNGGTVEDHLLAVVLDDRIAHRFVVGDLVGEALAHACSAPSQVSASSIALSSVASLPVFAL